MKTTIKELFEKAKLGNTDVPVTISSLALAELIWYAQGLAVMDICDQHTAILADARNSAKKMRYHHMAESILPTQDTIYDGRYSDASTFGEFDVDTPVGL